MPGNPVTDPEWASDIADSIERVVGTVRTTFTDRAVVVLRAVVYGLLIAIVAVAVFVMAVVVGTRLLQDLLELVVREPQRAVWGSYLLMSLILFGIGAICMRKRHSDELAEVRAS
jgi:hypothetical protein